MLQDGDLTPLERELCSAAATGRLLDSRCRHSDEDDPTRGQTWGKNRQIRAQVLRQLLTGEGCLDQTFGRPLAVRLRGASVSGRLNLGGLTVRCPLELYGCYLGGRLDLAKAEAPDISLRDSHLAQRLSVRQLRLTNNLNLTGGFRCHGRMDLRHGHIGGSLDCEGATLSNPDGDALSADGLTVDGNLLLTGATVTGEVRLPGARIGGQMVCGEATLSNPGGRALSADGLTVDGNLLLTGATVTGEVSLSGARIGDQLVCESATLSNSGGRALSADRLTVDAGLFLTSAAVTGEVRLLGARVGGQLACAGATLSNPGGDVLSADGLTVDGSLFLRSAKVTGEVRLPGARVGQLSCEKATLSNPGGYVFSADGLTVDGNLFLVNATVTGEVSLIGARVGGQLACGGATFSNPGGDVLSADGLTVDSDLFLRSVTVTGEARFLGARVGGQLGCEGATLSNPGGYALSADGLTVDGNLFLVNAKVTGEVRLPGARIGGQLSCEDATLSNPEGLALNLEHGLITGQILMRPALLDGNINLTAARAGGWYDHRRTWPTALNLEGFVYEAIDGVDVTLKQRLGWLHRDQDGYLPQPYEQLASVYRRAGDDQAARTVAIAKQRARRAQARRWWVRTPSRAWSFVLRWTIGYGYRPALVLPYLAGLFVIGWVVFDHAYPSELRPAKSGSGQPGFNPARYSLDLLLPVANLQQRQAFVPYGYAAWWAFGLTLAGWLLAVVVVAGLTGVFKRD